MRQNRKPSYYAILPASVRYDENLSSSEKLFFAELTALAEKEGFCWASNKYFAELYNVSRSTVSGWVASLREKGHIEVKIDMKGKEILGRRIYIDKSSNLRIKKNESSDHSSSRNLSNDGGQNIDHPWSENMNRGSQKRHRGWSKNPKENIIYNNNTSTTTKGGISKQIELVIRVWEKLFEVEVDTSDKKLMASIGQAVKTFGDDTLIQAMENRCKAKFYKEDKFYLRDKPEWFFPHPEYIRNDLKRTSYKLIDYETKIEYEMNGLQKKIDMDPDEKDPKGRPLWRVYD